jgi:hypothetical protein
MLDLSQGILEPTWVKSLVLDNGQEQFCFTTLDGIGSDENLNKMAHEIAVTMGFDIPLDNCLFSCSHTHSGPGAVSQDFLWSMAPATDLCVPELQRQLATSMAEAMVTAYKNMQPAVMAVGTGDLIGVTQNRRAGISHYVNRGTIDPHLGIIRVDTTDGKPIATVWNFAVHGTCYSESNMYFSGDIMGVSCEVIEETIGGVALFINGDAGDIDPTGAACSGAPNFEGAPIIAAAVKKVRDSLVPTADVQMNVASQVFNFGPTNLNITLQRFDNCTTGGELDICTICSILRCDLNAHLYSSWIEQTPRFTAFEFIINGNKSVMVSMPGEALVELGWWIRNGNRFLHLDDIFLDTLDMGYDVTLLAGYSNAHMGYFATPNEYDIGGYESQLTFWGIQTASLIRAGCKYVAEAVASGGQKLLLDTPISLNFN